jgi:hypothetical protein
VIAHIGALPLEELLPVLTGAGSGLLAVRARIVPRVRRRREASATTEPGSPKLPIRRNTALLSGAVATNTAMLQLVAAVAAISLARILEAGGLLGLGPAIVLAAGALAAVPAGRAMDRFGRIPVLGGPRLNPQMAR